MSALLETAWFLWWLFVAVVVKERSWHLSGADANRPYEKPAHWRNLYQQALVEGDETKVATCIHKAEGAILVELASQVFVPDGKERRSLQEAMNNLRSLRQNHSENSDLS